MWPFGVALHQKSNGAISSSLATFTLYDVCWCCQHLNQIFWGPSDRLTRWLLWSCLCWSIKRKVLPCSKFQCFLQNGSVSVFSLRQDQDLFDFQRRREVLSASGFWAAGLNYSAATATVITVHYPREVLRNRSETYICIITMIKA